RVVGTYRLISSTFSDIFYSATEFNLGDLLALPGVKLELGRACIDTAYRNGSVIAMLWNAICLYAQGVQAAYLFGCASVHTMDPVEVSKICVYLKERGSVAQNLDLRPMPAYRFENLPQTGVSAVCDEARDRAEAKRLVPPLLASYLKFG